MRRTKEARSGGVRACRSHLKSVSNWEGERVCHGQTRRRDAYRDLKRSQRMLTGASTLTSMKDGRRSRTSNTVSSQMSVVTQRSLHFNVTKSSRASAVSKWCSLIASGRVPVGTCSSDCDRSTDGVAAGRDRYRRLKPCSWMR